MRLLRYLIALLALGGAAVSVLALRVHLQDPNAAPPCSVTEHWDCGMVNHSRWSVLPPRSFDEDPKSSGHMPVAIAGIAGYLLLVALALGKLDFWVFEVSQVGVFLALGLTFVEKYILEKWCIYCVWSQGFMAAIFLLSVATLLIHRQRRQRDGLYPRTT